MIYGNIAGRLGRDASVKELGGTVAATFTVAAESGYGDRAETYWIDCTLWGNRGEKLAQYLTKGSPVTIIGELSVKTYMGKDGTPKASLQCRVMEIKLQGSKGGNGNGDHKPVTQKQPEPADTFDDDDIPF